jgi:hypothetical protein
MDALTQSADSLKGQIQPAPMDLDQKMPDFVESRPVAWQAFLYKSIPKRNPTVDMDQFWSVLSMPIGLMLCFTPVLIAWVINENRKKPEEKKERK